MSLNGEVHGDGLVINFLPAAGLVITTALTAVTTTPVELISGIKYVAFQVRFVYGSGGTNAKFWLQTTFDSGSTLLDIACLASTTASLNTVVSTTLTAGTALATPTTLTDGTLADNTIVQGLLGSQLRMKYTTTGTYAGSTTVYASAVVKG
jgi:hypothetical protein